VTTVATRHKPIPILSDDANALTQAGVPVELAEQIAKCHEMLAEQFRDTQRAITESNIDRIDRIVASAEKAEVDAIVAHFPA